VSSSKTQKPPARGARNTDNPRDRAAGGAVLAAPLLEVENPCEIPLLESPDSPRGQRPGESAALPRSFTVTLLIEKAKRH